MKTTEELRVELHKYINQADEESLEIIYSVMISRTETPILTEEQERRLQQTIKEHREGSPSYTWDEARAMIEKRK